MAAFQLLTDPAHPDHEVWVFHCPGCDYGHSVRTKGPEPCWQWNGDPTKPTVTPSLLVEQSNVDRRCHSFIRDGQILFLSDCHHKLAGQTVDIPDFEL